MSDDLEDTVQEETVEESSSQVNQNYELESIKEQVAQQSATLQQLLAVFKTSQQGTATSQEMSQLQELAKDPAKAAAYLKEQTLAAKKEIQNEARKQNRDNEALKRFPIETDPVFKQAVLRKMQELIRDDNYSPDHPMLTLRAAELVAATYKSNGQQTRRPGSQMTSEAPATRSKGVGPSQSSVKIDNNDPRLVWGRDVYGIKGESLEKFKKELADLGPYKAPERQRTRTLVKKERS